MKPRSRLFVLGTAAVALLGLVILSPPPRAASNSIVSARQRPSRAGTLVSAGLVSLRNRAADGTSGVAFLSPEDGPHDVMAVAQIEAPIALPPPGAPPFPYKIIGKVHDAAGWRLYLALGEETSVATEHSNFGDVYRVDAIEEHSITVTYLPLGQQQIIPAGSHL